MAQTEKSSNLVTMRDVARAAGVSRMTVSRALKKDSPISKETRERILKIVRDMNYVPDHMAGSLSTKRSGFVAVLVPSLNNLHFAETVQALTEELENIDQQILLGHTDYSVAREEQLVEDMLKRRPEAIVLSYDGHSDRTIELLDRANVPVIELWERPDNPVGHMIGFSNREAAASMTRALIAKGYKWITFLGEADDDWTRGAARRAGYQDAMAEAGLPTDRVIKIGKPPLSIEDGATAAGQLMAEYPDTECVFCVSDAPAFGILSALLSSGKSVPADIGIVGFGNFEVSRFSTPTISTVAVDPKTIGRESGRLIAKLLEKGSDLSRQSIQIEPQLIFRSSTK